jgi:hypothetical protein
MKNGKIVVLLIIFVALLAVFQDKIKNFKPEKKENSMEQKNDTIPEAWEEMCNAPQGYPIEVYKGGLEKRDENGGVINSTGLNTKLSTGYNGWGESGGGMKRSNFVPTHIDCIWLSYAEGIFYQIDSPIDHEKMLKLFQEGYLDSLAFLNYGKREKSYYDSIIVGFAPGGVVVIWVAGSGRQVEIGRYKGKKIEIDPTERELEIMGYPTRNLFDPKYRNFIVTNKDVVPLEVQKANIGKPIPYGLWDSYRTRYAWRPVFEVPKEGVMRSAYMEMFNGEKEKLFDIPLKENKYEKRAIIKHIYFSWRDNKKQGYACEIDFDEQEIKAAFDAMYKENKDLEVELVFTINHSNNFVTVMLKGGDKKIPLPKTKVKAYKTRGI